MYIYRLARFSVTYRLNFTKNLSALCSLHLNWREEQWRQSHLTRRSLSLILRALSNLKGAADRGIILYLLGNSGGTIGASEWWRCIIACWRVWISHQEVHHRINWCEWSSIGTHTGSDELLLWWRATAETKVKAWIETSIAELKLIVWLLEVIFVGEIHS